MKSYSEMTPEERIKEGARIKGKMDWVNINSFYELTLNLEEIMCLKETLKDCNVRGKNKVIIDRIIRRIK